MPQRIQIPFNVSILELVPKRLEGLRPCTRIDIFDGQTSDFNQDGLFSTLTFGRVGDPIRLKKFSYIDIKIPIMHPIGFEILSKMKALYGEIMAGRGYAVWDKIEMDFVRSSPVEGKTGYAFFMQHFKDIRFHNRGSQVRERYIKLIDKYKDKWMSSKIVVIPAGVRDLEMQPDGNYTMDEINEIYQRLMSLSNTVTEQMARGNNPQTDNIRYNLQVVFNQLYRNIMKRLSGKRGFISDKWASRRTQHGTANVITAMAARNRFLGAKNNITFDHSIIGIYQAMKSEFPKAAYAFRRGFISKLFIDPRMPVKLVNEKTLHAEDVKVDVLTFDSFTTREGFNKLLNRFENEALRSKPVVIGMHYLSLTYIGPDNTFKFISDINEIPEGRSRDNVKPTTWGELFYASVYEALKDVPGYTTRYPITGFGSIYPSLMYVKTTTTGRGLYELNENWQVDPEKYAPEFPLGTSYVHGIIPHPSRIGELGADYDGDRCNWVTVHALESREEVRKFLNTNKAFINPNGSFGASMNIKTVNLVLRNITGD